MWPVQPAWGIAVVRIAMAIILVSSGYAKVNDLGGVIGFFGNVGIPAPGITAPFIAGLEFIGGILLLIGLFGRWLGLLYFIEFIVAFSVALQRGWPMAMLEFLLIGCGLMLFLGGSGRASVDDMLGRRRVETATTVTS